MSNTQSSELEQILNIALTIDGSGGELYNHNARKIREAIRAIEKLMVRERLDELGGIWFKSSSPAEYSSIRTDIAKGGQTLGERAYDLQKQLEEKA